MLKIISAYYDILDVTDIVNSYVKDNKLQISVLNEIFTDPKQFKVKKLSVTYEYEGIVRNDYAYEGYVLKIPKEELGVNNILLLTSCNRVKQVILALTINSFIIKKPFHLIIADSSTPYLDVNAGVNMHNNEPYNHVNEKNYCSDIDLFEDGISRLNNVISYNIIHTKPRLEKGKGDANLITIGLSQASLIGSINTKENYCLKLSGVAILREDILSPLQDLLTDKDVLTYHRSHFGHGEYSSRVFGCKPQVVSSITQKAGWQDWVSTIAGDTEFRFADILNKYVEEKVLYTGKDESCLIDNTRNSIENHIRENNIPLDIPIIKEFIEGGII
jgi:hypothetical protein